MGIMTPTGDDVDTPSRNGEDPERPHPFLLPSDTPFRFGLLILAVLSTSLFAYQMLYLDRHRSAFMETITRCGQDLPGGGLQRRADAAHLSALCRQPFERHEAVWMVVGALGVLLVAALLAAGWAIARHRRRGRFPLLASESPELTETLRHLVEDAGLGRVTFLIEPMDTRTSAFAYGLPGRRTIVLRGGLVTLSVTKPEAFRAVVRHELAHIRNRDIDLTYLAVCVFVSFVLVAVVPFIVTLGGSLPVWPMLWRMVSLTTVVVLLLAALLRSRERYADARAAQWGSEAALDDVLQQASRADAPLWQRVVAFHPAPAARARTIRDGRALFQLSFIDCVAAGLVAALALPQMIFLFDLITAASLTGAAWAAGLLAPLIGGFMVVAIWRNRQFAAATGSAGRMWPLGAGLGIGLAIGSTFAISTTATADVGPQGLLNLLWHASWTLLVVVAVTILCAWIGEGAATTLRRGTWQIGTTPRFWCFVAMAVGAFVFGHLLYLLQQLRIRAFVTVDERAIAVLMQPFDAARLLLHPLSLHGAEHLGALVALLLLPWLAARASAGQRVFRSAAAVGAAGGVLVAIFIVASFAFAHQAPLEVRWVVPFASVLALDWQYFAFAACALAAISMVAVAATRPLARAGIAAVAAGVAGTLVLGATRPLSSCVPVFNAVPHPGATTMGCPSFSTWQYWQTAFSLTLAGGLAASIILAPTAVGLIAVFRQIRQAEVKLRPPGRALRRALLALAIAGAFAIVAGAPVSANRAREAGEALQPVDIGRDGAVTRPGFTVGLPYGWVVRPGDQTALLLVTDTDPNFEPTAQIIVARLPISSLAALRSVRGIDVQATRPVDGEPALRYSNGAEASEVVWTLATEHAGTVLGIQLAGSKEERAYLHRAGDAVMASWQWVG